MPWLSYSWLPVAASPMRRVISLYPLGLTAPNASQSNSPQAVLALISHGQARQVCETWWPVAQLSPYSQDGAYKLSLSCFCFFFLLSAATRLSSGSLSLHTPQVAAQQGPETLRVVFWGAPCCVSVRKQIKIMSGSYMCFWHGGEEIYLLILQGK